MTIILFVHFPSRHLESKIDKHCAKTYIMWSMIAWQHFLHKASIRTVPSREIVPRGERWWILFCVLFVYKLGWRILEDTFFSKWMNSSGHFQRMNFRGNFLSTRILLLGCIFVNIFWVNSSGHFLMVITNSANTVDQPMQGVRGQSPC